MGLQYLQVPNLNLILIFLHKQVPEYANWLSDSNLDLKNNYRIIGVSKEMRECAMPTTFAPGDKVRILGGYDGGEIQWIDTEKKIAGVKSPDGFSHTVSLNLLVKSGEDPYKTNLNS